jgi:hypothetical protein
MNKDFIHRLILPVVVAVLVIVTAPLVNSQPTASPDSTLMKGAPIT